MWCFGKLDKFSHIKESSIVGGSGDLLCVVGNKDDGVICKI